MIKNTPDDHSDLVSLNRASERMKKAVATINESARKLGGIRPMLEVQAKFAEVYLFNIRKSILLMPIDI
jgi:hypothetical protein